MAKQSSNPELNKKITLHSSCLRKFEWSPERIFLFTGLFFGILLVFITPPFQVPDEDAHFLRAYTISDGRFVNHLSDTMTGTGDMVPKSLIATIEQSECKRIRNHPDQTIRLNTIINLFRISLNPDQKEFVTLYMTSYPPVLFLPQAAGIEIGRVFRLPPIVLMYLGRLCNLACWILLMTAAIRLAPIFKWVMLLLALMPMSVFLSASLSADALANGGALLFIALILNHMFSERKIEKSDILILFITGCFTALCKQVYFPLLLLYFFIPSWKFTKKSKYVLIGSLLILTGVSLSFLWSQVILHGYPFNVKTAEDVRIIHDARPAEKVQFIKSYPFFHVRSILYTIVKDLPRYLRTFTGTLGWLDTVLPQTILYSYPVLLIVLALTDQKPDIVFNWKQKMMMILFVIIPIILILFTVAAIAWNAPGIMYIKGIQGRYFIPITPLLLLLLYNQKIKASLQELNLLIAAYSWITLIIVFVTLINRYYTG